jgi:release factor glutamine methyltransferase
MTVDARSIGTHLPALKPGMSIEAARRLLAQEFRHYRLDSPDLDARLLVGHVLGLDHTALAAQSGRSLATTEAGAIAALAARRLAREPVARILGVKEFWGLPFRLNAETLVPRPESETLIEATLAALDRKQGRARALRVADLGTGSGALLIALLSELSAAHGIGTDISLAALACARDNARALGCAGRASFVACDYGAALAGPFDLLLCNPPYVAHGEIAGLQPEVRLFDPLRALDGGPDGLDGYRALAADARRLLAPNGNLVVELGFAALDAVSALFTTAGLGPAEPPRHDLAGVARALVVKPLP